MGGVIHLGYTRTTVQYLPRSLPEPLVGRILTITIWQIWTKVRLRKIGNFQCVKNLELDVCGLEYVWWKYLYTYHQHHDWQSRASNHCAMIMIIASHNCKLVFLKTTGATADGDVDLFGVAWESNNVWLLNNGDKPATFLTVSTPQMYWTGTYTTSVSDFDGGTLSLCSARQ
jgi:hypothetical protein